MIGHPVWARSLACVLVELLNVELLHRPMTHAGRGACADPCFPWPRIR
jgi:hypothetical protein